MLRGANPKHFLRLPKHTVPQVAGVQLTSSASKLRSLLDREEHYLMKLREFQNRAATSVEPG
jgi:hypothetical protein